VKIVRGTTKECLSEVHHRVPEHVYRKRLDVLNEKRKKLLERRKMEEEGLEQ